MRRSRNNTARDKSPLKCKRPHFARSIKCQQICLTKNEHWQKSFRFFGLRMQKIAAPTKNYVEGWSRTSFISDGLYTMLFTALPKRIHYWPNRPLFTSVGAAAITTPGMSSSSVSASILTRRSSILARWPTVLPTGIPVVVWCATAVLTRRATETRMSTIVSLAVQAGLTVSRLTTEPTWTALNQRRRTKGL